MKFFHRYENLYDKSKILLLDLDGTVYRGDAALESIEILNTILKQKTVTFLTNSGTKTAEDVKCKLKIMGFSIDDRVFHCYTALQHLKNILDEKHGYDILYVSNRNIKKALGCDKSVFNTLTIDKAFEFVNAQKCSNIIVAFFVDTIETLDLDEVITAASIILSNGGHVYFSAGDTVVPTCKNGRYVNHPGPGSIIAMLRSMSTITDNLHILGKGFDTNFMENAFFIAKGSYLFNNPSATCAWKDVIVVGDNPMTDIAGGLQMGATTVLVNTGMTNQHDRLHYNRPHFLADTLGNVMDSEKACNIGFHNLLDILARKALRIHKCLNGIANSSLSYCLDGISSAPIKKTQSLPSRLNIAGYES